MSASRGLRMDRWGTVAQARRPLRRWSPVLVPSFSFPPRHRTPVRGRLFGLITHDGDTTWTLAARGVTVAASGPAPAAVAVPTATPPSAGYPCAAGCGVWLPPRATREYCSPQCRREARARRRGVPPVAAPSSP